MQDSPVVRDGAPAGRRLTVEFLPGQAYATAALARLLFQPGARAVVAADTVPASAVPRQLSPWERAMEPSA